MAQQSDNFRVLPQNNRFDDLDNETKENLLINRKAVNTNRATKQWVQCLNAYLQEKNLPDLDSIDHDELPKVIGDFYFLQGRNAYQKTESIQVINKEQKQNSDIIRILL